VRMFFFSLSVRFNSESSDCPSIHSRPKYVVSQSLSIQMKQILDMKNRIIVALVVFECEWMPKEVCFIDLSRLSILVPRIKILNSPLLVLPNQLDCNLALESILKKELAAEIGL